MRSLAEQRQTPGAEPLNQHIALDLAQRGWSVVDDYLHPLLFSQLAVESEALWQSGAFHNAGVGAGSALRVRPEVRSDQILWLNSESSSVARNRYLSVLESLRLAINRELLLGLFDFEGHLALYPVGSSYRKHLDQFQDAQLRTVSCILYLNQDWKTQDGGQLRIYTDSAVPDQYEDVSPIGGRLVTFLSARFPHEVLRAKRRRLSITGWFKRRDGRF